jgi:hypothetical protein
MTVTATDVDVPPQTITFSIVGGSDQARFSITTGGAVSFSTPPDFDSPADANGDNVYVVTVRASDGNGGTAMQTISVTVSPLNDNAPVFTSPDAVSLPENSTNVVKVTASDADLPPQMVTLSIVGGADEARFNLASDGQLSFKTPPNFEAPTDSNGDNIYVVVVQASDGGLTNLQAILVTVTNVVVEPLVGDYNGNGAVDAADYVLWRNGGPLQNEGTTPGAVTPEDYNVWRANFGKTADSPGAGALVVEAALTTTEIADNSVANAALASPTSVPAAQVDHPSSPPIGNGEVITPPRFARRASPRGAVVPPTLRDDALVAWLTSRDRGD